ncbi:MAG: hypothetical protein MUO76_06185, partial [Anaerolineaceae bacterium]|nr:hypothetical protein [Anaerolineaceae bacterium]
MLQISTLGRLSIHIKGQQISGFASRKAEALLVYLVVTGQTQPREYLADLLWDDEDHDKAMASLRVVLSSLRKTLKPYIIISRDRVGIHPEADIHVDAAELLGEFDAPTKEAEIDHLKGVLNLYQGDFLLGFHIRNARRFENWVIVEREQIRAAFDKKNQRLLNHLITSGQWHDAIGQSENWISRSLHGHTPESAYRALMRAYAGLENLPGLSSVYQRCVQYLKQELGVNPSEKTQQLYMRLLDGGPPIEPGREADEAATLTTGDSPAQVVLNQWRASEAEIIDITSFALVYASRAGLKIGAEEVDLLVRSALHYNLDVEPWLRYFDTNEGAVQTLKECLASNSNIHVRMQIIKALKEIPSEEA